MAEPEKPITATRQAFIALVQSALRKQAAREALTPKESRAIDQWNAEENERRGRLWLRSLTKKQYCELVGRQVKVVNDQADRYGIPLRGATVDALEVFKWIHDFLAKHKHTLPAIIHGEPGAASPSDQLKLEQIEVYRRRVKLLENKIELAEETLLPRVEVHELLAQLAKVLRGAGERLHKQHGPQAASILEVALTDFDTMIEQLATKTESPAASSEHATPANN
jgi:hypothetical protein